MFSYLQRVLNRFRDPNFNNASASGQQENNEPWEQTAVGRGRELDIAQELSSPFGEREELFKGMSVPNLGKYLSRIRERNSETMGWDENFAMNAVEMSKENYSDLLKAEYRNVFEIVLDKIPKLLNADERDREAIEILYGSRDPLVEMGYITHAQYENSEMILLRNMYERQGTVPYSKSWPQDMGDYDICYKDGTGIHREIPAYEQTGGCGSFKPLDNAGDARYVITFGRGRELNISENYLSLLTGENAENIKTESKNGATLKVQWEEGMPTSVAIQPPVQKRSNGRVD